MRKKMIRLIALVLAMVMLSGCGYVDFGQYIHAVKSMLDGNAVVPYESMQYERPDMGVIEQSLEAACTAAQGEDVDAILESIYSFYDAYDWYYTWYNLADIRYSGDLTDTYWEKEYNYCVEHSAEVDAALEELYYALAKSPCRDTLEEEYFGSGFFDSYDGENLWDAEFVSLLEQEAQLQNRYYALSELGLDYESASQEYYDACADEEAQLLVEMVALRQEMAAYWGYDTYAQFANDFYYYRDYTVEEMKEYLQQIRQELVPLYRSVAMSDHWDAAYDFCTETQTLHYVRETAQNMGGTVLEAFELMEGAGLYDISYGQNKYNSSFELYLTSYMEPFVFMNPGMTAYDKLTFAHEFGHFCNDYASYGSYAGVDVLEVFSQGMEYLSLCYGEDRKALTRVKMADSLCTYVEQAAFADFEQRMYDLSGEELTVDGLYGLYDSIAQSYGFDSVGYDKREFVDIVHFYTNPLYIISYVVSNDAAMQLYQLEQEESGAGRKRFEENLSTEEVYFLAFLEAAELESPFADGRIQQVRQTFEELLKE